MKKHLLFVAALGFAMSFTDCREPQWDYFNANVGIVVRNALGDNLLSPNKSGNILSEDITVEYDGNTYHIENLSDWVTRADGTPEFDGLKFNGQYGDSAMLLFGEFGPDVRDYHGETFVINWADGSSNEIAFDLYAVKGKNKNDKPTVRQSTWLDGEINSESSLIVTIRR